MRYLALLEQSYIGSQLVFNQDEFQKLNVLIVDSSDITNISFTGTSPNLEKIVWWFSTIDSLSGIENLSALKELQLNGYFIHCEVKEDNKKLKSSYRLDYTHKNPQYQVIRYSLRSGKEGKCIFFSNWTRRRVIFTPLSLQITPWSCHACRSCLVRCLLRWFNCPMVDLLSAFDWCMQSRIGGPGESNNAINEGYHRKEISRAGPPRY